MPGLYQGRTNTYAGDVAEWLGKGLQNPVRRFESARHLKNKASLDDRVEPFL